MWKQKKNHISTKFGVALSITSLAIIVLASVWFSTLTADIQAFQTSILSHASTNVTVAILPSLGGTINPPSGNYSLNSGTMFTLKADPESGFTFEEWIIYSANTQIQTEGNAAPTVSCTSTTENPLTIKCAAGYVDSVQAVFKPASEVAVSEGMTTTEATAAILFLIAVVMAEAVGLAFLYTKRMRQ